MAEPGDAETRDEALARLTESLVSRQEKKASEAKDRARMTPAERKAEAVQRRIDRMPWGKPTTDIDIAREQAAMEGRSSDHRTARGQLEMHGSVGERPKVEEPEEEE